MLVAIIYLLISFILENFMGNIFQSSLANISFFTTIYTVIGITVIYPYFSNYKKYYVLVGIFGILFDIVYTGTFFFTLFMFMIITIAIRYLYSVLSENIVMTNLISMVSVIMYHLLSFLILSITNYADYSLELFLNVIMHSIFMTVIYTSISYGILKLLYNKYNIRQVK